MLYTIGPKSSWFRVGEIRACQVLEEAQAMSALAEFKKRGWYDEMRAHVSLIQGRPRALQTSTATELFNVRFRPEDAEVYEPMVPVRSSDVLLKQRRYNLVDVSSPRNSIRDEWATRVGTTQKRAVGKIPRSGQLATQVDLVHSQLQQELYEALKTKFRNGVIMEEGYVDVKLRLGSESVLFEVKSDPNPIAAIREAVGQLLQYAYQCGLDGERVSELVVVGPGHLGDRERRYLRHLRHTRGLPISYLCWRSGMTVEDLAEVFSAEALG